MKNKEEEKKTKIEFTISSMNRLVPTWQQYRFHEMFRDSSFFIGIIPNDNTLQKRWFILYKYFQIIFMILFCFRRLLETILPKGSPLYWYIGDFKRWWGEPYIVNQVVWDMAAILVPCYQFINLLTLCQKDLEWTAPFRFIEGLYCDNSYY